MTDELVAMSIKGLMLDPVSNSPIVVLKDDEEKFFLPIWVGIFEANAIALQLESITTPRPMTHDLLRNLIAQLGGRVTRIVINDLRDSTFFAQIGLIAGGRNFDIDARPSDAIALALRTESPIFVAQSVLEQAQTISPGEAGESEESEDKMKKWFDNLSPEEMGKYKM
jgi:bifunctional DNase/RNase